MIKNMTFKSVMWNMWHIWNVPLFLPKNLQPANHPLSLVIQNFKTDI